MFFLTTITTLPLRCIFLFHFSTDNLYTSGSTACKVASVGPRPCSSAFQRGNGLQRFIFGGERVKSGKVGVIKRKEKADRNTYWQTEMKTHMQLDLRTDSRGETKSRSVRCKRPGASLLPGAAPGTGVSQQIRLTDESALLEDCQLGLRPFQIRYTHAASAETGNDRVNPNAQS